MQGIYAIVNTVNGKRYVGSALVIQRRWKYHRQQLAAGTHHCQPLQRAWNKYGADAFRWDVLEEVADKLQLVACEQVWIDATPRAMRYNTAPKAGSNIGIVRSETFKQLLRAYHTGRKRPASVGLAISDAKAGKPLSDEHKVALRGLKKGKPWSESRRAAAAMTPEAAAERSRKLSEARKGKPLTEAHRQALSAAHRGKTHSEAHNRAVSAAKKGRPTGDAHKHALSAALKGRPWSEARCAAQARKKARE